MTLGSADGFRFVLSGRAALAALVVAILASAMAWGQEAPDSGLEERVEVRLVELSIVATDRFGFPVTDLKPSDLRVRARGKRVEVAHLERAIEASVDPGSLPRVALSLRVPGSEPSARIETPGPRQYYILFIDVENDARHERPAAASQLVTFVEDSLGPNDLVSVVAYDGELRVETAFTNDRSAIQEALFRAYDRPARAGISTEYRIRDLLDRLPECEVRGRRRGQKSFDGICVRERFTTYLEEVRPDIEDYIDTLGDLVRYASGLRGQATVLAVTHGRSYQPGYEFMEAVQAVYGFTDEVTRLQPMMLARGAMLRSRVERVLREALRRNVVVYVLDRSTTPYSQGAEQATPLSAGAQPYFVAYMQAQNDMAAIALDTGGNVVRHFDLTDAGSRVLEYEEGRYTLGFYASELLTTEELRKIEVKPRRKGLRISTGRGSYVGRSVDRTLDGRFLLRDPVRSAARQDAVIVPFQLEIDPQQLGYQRVEDVYRAGLTLHLVAETVTGRRLAEVYHFFTHEYGSKTWENDRARALTLAGAIEAPVGQYRLIAVAHNPLLGAGGRVMADIDVSARVRAGGGTGQEESVGDDPAGSGGGSNPEPRAGGAPPPPRT